MKIRKELLPGNYIIYYGYICEVKSTDGNSPILLKQICEANDPTKKLEAPIEIYSTSDELLQPIPLNENILILCEFDVDINDQNLFRHRSLTNVEVELQNGNIWLHYINPISGIPEAIDGILSLHKLQNAFKNLLNQELSVPF